MTLGKSLALAMGFVVAMALGVWVGPFLTDRAPFNRDHTTAAQTVASGQAPKPQGVARATGPPRTNRRLAKRPLPSPSRRPSCKTD